MELPVEILLVEDNPADAELIYEILTADGLNVSFRRVESREEFEAALLENAHHLILSDYSLPSFDGLRALALARERCPDVPFVLISGTLGEETAIESFRAGASDYVLKQRLERLPPVIRRALKETEERRKRRDAEAALRQSEERYRDLVETACDLVWEIDANARYTYASPRVFDLLGYEPREVIGRTPYDLMPPAEGQRIREVFAGIANRREPFAMLENLNLHRDGRLVVLESSGTPIIAPDGTFRGYRGVDRDITLRRQTEEQLRKLARGIEQSPAAITITDRSGTIEFVNPKFTRLTGYTAEEAVGQNPRILKSGETTPEEYRQLWETITSGNEWRGLFHNRRKDGTLFWASTSISPVRDNSGEITHFIGVGEDVTEKRLTEAKLLRAQRVESIGSLASGIAHDLNNILTPIIMCADLLPMEETHQGRLELIQTIESSANRAVEIVKQLLTFARGKEGQKQPVHVRHLVRDMAKIARETFPRNIQVQENCSRDLWPISADATQIHQVLLNLCVNARDAMPSGGSLTLRAENVYLDEHFASMEEGVSAGPYVRIEVRDTGIGMPESVQSHIFESFFTTKGEEEGTGLGLTTVQGIVRDHNGFINFTSAPGKGTAFVVHLPAAPQADPQQDALAEPSPRGNAELVLVVDDESAICETTRKTLERHGYSVIQAQNGIEGLAQFSAHQKEVRVVVTDSMMPLMDGVTLARALRALSPTTPIIVSSGGLFGKPGINALHAFEELGIRHVLHKPHTAEVLLRALNEILRGPPPEDTPSVT